MKIQRLFSKKTLLILTGVIAFYTLAGFILLPLLAKNILQDKLGQALDRQVVIEKVSLNPYTFSATLNSVVIREKNNDILFSVQRLYGNLSLSSLFSMALVVSDISVDAPFVNITRNSDNTFNFSDLLAKKENQTLSSPEIEDKENEKDIFNFVLKKAAIHNGKFQFDDKAVETIHVLEDLSFSLVFLSSKREKRYEKSNVDLSFVLNGTPVNIKVASTPFAEDHATQADIKTKNIDVLHYLSYLPLPETLVLKDLDFNLDVKGDFKKKENKMHLVVQGSANALNTDIKNTQNVDILNFPSLAININPSDLLDRKVNIAKIVLSSPKIHLDRDEQGKLNLLNHIPESGQSDNGTGTGPDITSKQHPDAVAKTAKEALSISLETFEIKGSEIFFKDNSNKTPFETRVFPLNLTFTNVAATENVSGEYSLDLNTDKKEKLTSNGSFSLQPMEASGQIDLADIGFGNYAPYFEHLVDFTIKDGKLNLSCDFDLTKKEGQIGGTIKNKALLVQDLVLYEGSPGIKSGTQTATIADKQKIDKAMILIPEFKVNDSIIDLTQKSLSTGSIVSNKGNIQIKRLKDGQMNLVQSVQPKDPGTISGSPVSQGAVPDAASGGEEKSGAPWAVCINALDIKNYVIAFKDFSNTDPAEINLSRIGVHADNLQTTGSKKGNVAVEMIWNKAGRIHITGGMDLAALKGDLDINLKKIDIKSLQPYFTDTVKILVTKGEINTKGRLDLRLHQKENQIRFKGSSSVTDFICLDKKSSKDFFKCNSLYVSNISFSATPVVVEAKDISLTDFYSRVIVGETGEMNIANILEKDSVEQKEEKPEKARIKDTSQGPKIDIANVTLQGGNINFSDYLTKPNFTADMKQIAGSLTGLSSEQESRAKLHLQGVHGQSSPLEIVGDINPLAPKKFVDIDISYKDIELSDFSPYASKFLGYKIEKGKLILDLEYIIDGNSLKSENRVRFDNFTLGESVDSEHATSLPISLAISLLKDGDGQINLDLPVTGELDDPEFSIGGIVLKMIGNLIKKVITSPFSILGAMFGGGEDLGYIEFGFGEIQIDEGNLQKLDTLVNILEKKTDINLEIQGMYHPEQDSEAMRTRGFYDLLKAEKLQDMMKSGSAPETLDQIVLKDEEIEGYLNRAYASAEFPKPRDEKGDEKEIGLLEKTKLLKTSVKVGNDDLRLLAMNRSKEIKAYIISTQKVDAERVFLLEPDEIEDAEDSSSTSKAQFSLKQN